MQDESGQPPGDVPESKLPYDDWTEDALRHVVRRAIEFASKAGLPGAHHFYVTFRTDFPGVAIPPHLRAKYPREMTIVLQHQFWDLRYEEVPDRISVGLSFGGIPSTLLIPIAAVTGFADPVVRFGLRFRAPDGLPEEDDEEEDAEAGDAEIHTLDTPKPAPTKAETKTDETKTDDETPPAAPQVISLDAFRRRKD